MINQTLTNPKTGEPVTNPGSEKTTPKYTPPEKVKKLWEQVSQDYFRAYALQNRPFEEFDMLSLLQRMNQDQQTWGAFVGANYSPTDQEWRWQGRKNTARNKIIGILAHVVSGMLYPFVYAYNEDNEEDKLTAKVMRILIKDHLIKANYEQKFLFAMLSALVNPAVFLNVEYIEAIQKIKLKDPSGKWRVEEVVDEILTGIQLNLIPVDQMLLGDFYTFDIQRQPYIIKVRRISVDEARAIYGGKFYQDGVDIFDYVQPGQMNFAPGAGRDYQTIYNIDWTNADQNFVQEITAYYKSEDLEVTFVGGVFFGNYEDPYNSNPFKKRKVTTDKKTGGYITAPVYPFAKSGFEPIDPNGRFAYYKSAAFKEYWDDASQNRMYQLAQDGTYLDVFKPMFLSGMSSVDASVMVPGATIGMPQGATVTPYQLGPNLQAAIQMMNINKDDMSLSTQDALQSGFAEKGVTATASLKAEQNARIVMNVFSSSIADLIRQVGDLLIQDVLLHTTVGMFNQAIPEELAAKYRTIRTRDKENGRDMNYLVQFDPNMMLPNFSKEKAENLEWELFDKHGGKDANTHEYIVNPEKFFKSQFTCYVDPDVIISKSMGTDQLRKERAFQMLTNPAISPYVDMAEIVDEFVLKDFSDGDIDKFKNKAMDPNNQMAQAMFGNPQQGPIPAPVTPQIAPAIPG